MHICRNITAILLLFPMLAPAQQLTTQTTNSAGYSSIGNNVILDYSVGEPLGIYFNVASASLVQGVLQPALALSVLPVTQLIFSGYRKNISQVQLEWKTQQETNNKGFYVERRNDNESIFVITGFIESKATGGNSSVPLRYQQTDENNYAGKIFYRLKQEDYDGHVTYSSTIVIPPNDLSTNLKVWPVPASGYFFLRVNSDKNETVQVIDASGKLLRVVAVQSQATVKIDNLRAGIYFIRLTGVKEEVQKMIIQ